MKKIIFTIIAIASVNSHANCLSGVDSAQIIRSEIRGFYIRSGTSHFVILDKAGCSVHGAAAIVGQNTKTSYYLKFEDSDKFLQSALLMAYVKGDKVDFRIGDAVGGYNPINYIVTPHSARNQ